MRVQRERRPSKVNHPSPAHTEHVIPAPTAAQPPSYVSSNVSDHSEIDNPTGRNRGNFGSSLRRPLCGWVACRSYLARRTYTLFKRDCRRAETVSHWMRPTAERVSASLSRVRSLYGLHGLRYAFYPK
jgi:hypothetical protein